MSWRRIYLRFSILLQRSILYLIYFHENTWSAAFSYVTAATIHQAMTSSTSLTSIISDLSRPYDGIKPPYAQKQWQVWSLKFTRWRFVMVPYVIIKLLQTQFFYNFNPDLIVVFLGKQILFSEEKQLQVLLRWFLTEVHFNMYGPPRLLANKGNFQICLNFPLVK